MAKRAGIDGAENYVDASTLASEKDITEAVDKYTVFGRVTPKQKQLIVRALQKQKHTVAMTGDGVNDILAMKDADCSIAMASGSEAAAQAAQTVLLDSDFGRMPYVVFEGRQVVNNIQRSIFSSVVPALTPRLREALRKMCECQIMEVGPGLKSGVRIRMDNPAQLGGELLCAIVGALQHCTPPCVVVNFDTATTLTVPVTIEDIFSTAA